MTKSPRIRFRLAYSARIVLAILVLFVLADIGIGLSVWIPYYWEQQVIRKIETWGGYIGSETGGPNWLRQVVGNKYMKVFDRVIVVNLPGKEITDAEVAHLSGLTNLQGLDLHDTAVTDAGLAHLSGLTNLKRLSLELTPVTDAGLAHLSGLTNLEVLSLSESAATDAGLARLGGLTKLQQLYVIGTAVTDAGLANLSRLPNLETLFLDDTAVTDAGLAHLSRLTKLRYLDLRANQTQVTDKGIEELKNALPDCYIIR